MKRYNPYASVIVALTIVAVSSLGFAGFAGYEMVVSARWQMQDAHEAADVLRKATADLPKVVLPLTLPEIGRKP